MTIYLAAKEREKAEKAQKLAQQKQAAEAASRLSAASSTSKKGTAHGGKKSGTSTPLRGKDAKSLDLSGLNLTEAEESTPVEEPPPKITIAREKVLEEARQALQNNDAKKAVNLVVIG